MATGADTNNWDTVSAIKFKAVNEAIKSQHSSPPSFSGPHTTVQGRSVTVTGDFGDWQLSGGSGNLVHMKLPFTSANATPSGEMPRPIGSGYGQIEINLDYIPQPGDTNQQDLMVDASKAVHYVHVTINDSTKTNFAPAVSAVLTAWLKANLQKFNHIFAVVSLGAKETSPAFKWLRPIKIGYAVETALDGSVDDYVFGVLALTDRGSPDENNKAIRAAHNLSSTVSPFAIPDGSDGGFLISPERFLAKIFMPGVYKLFKNKKTSTADFDITSDGTQITNIKALDLPDLEVPTNKSGTETKTVTDVKIGTGDFKLTAFSHTLQIEFVDMNFSWLDGTIVNLTYRGTVKLTAKDNKFDMLQVGKPTVAVVVTKTEEEKEWELWRGVLIDLAVAVFAALVGAGIGALFEAGSEAAANAGSEAAVNTASNAPIELEVIGEEPNDLTEPLLNQEAADLLEQPNDAQPVPGFFARNWRTMVGVAVVGFVGSGIAGVPGILQQYADAETGGPSKIPTLDHFADQAVSSVKWANTSNFKMNSLTLNQSMQMGLIFTQG